jgi:2,3-dihydroxybenzoate-AMP ligase
VPFPSAAAAAYRAAGYWGRRTIAEELHDVALRRGAHPAVVTDEGTLTYAELDDATDRLAFGLSQAGLCPGERVIVQLTNRLHSVVTWYGLLKAGLVPVCTLAAHRAHEIGPISRTAGATAHLVEWSPRGFDLIAFAHQQQRDHPTLRLVLTAGAPAGAPGTRTEDLASGVDPGSARRHVEALQARIHPDEVVAFQLSGGTTGVPKIIPRRHAEYWYNARAYAEAGGWGHDTRVAHLIPIIHNAGITCGLHAAHSVGGTLVLGTPVLDQSLPLVARESTTDVLLGHGHFGIVDHPLFDRATASLRRVVLSGAKVPERVFAAFEERGIWVGQKFGMGEGFFAMSTQRSSRQARLTTVGVPVSPADEFRVLEPGTEIEVAEGETGELVCRGPYTIPGYFDAQEANATAFTTDGFFRTGDLVAVRTVDGERCLSIEGRIKDLINRGGEKVSAEEVETLLLRHPRVTAVAVVAVPDERLGERACAVVVTRGEPLTMPEMQEHLEGQSLAKFKWPERIESVGELPRTALGKLDKKRMQRDLVARMVGDHSGSDVRGE